MLGVVVFQQVTTDTRCEMTSEMDQNRYSPLLRSAMTSCINVVKVTKSNVLTDGGCVDAELSSQQQEGFSQDVNVHLNTQN